MHSLDDWYALQTLPDGVTLIWERAIKPDYRCNIWHLRGRDRDLLFDSGFGMRSLRRAIPALAERDLIAVASHAHCDHIGAHHEFPCTAIHALEAEILRRPTRRNTLLEPYLCAEMFEHPVPEIAGLAELQIQPCEPTLLLQAGDRIDLGDRSFEVIHLPGHSPGSLALWEAASGLLLSGDVVHDGPRGIGRYVWYHSNEDDFLHSAERLLALPVQTVHAGHYASFGRRRYGEILREYIARRRGAACPLG